LENFKSHKAAAEEHVKKIEQLQLDVEAIAYERDSILQKALEQGTNLTEILAKRKKKKKADADGNVEAMKDSIQEVIAKTNKSIFESFKEYRLGLLTPNGRKRGGERSAFIANLIAEVVPEGKKKGK